MDSLVREYHDLHTDLEIRPRFGQFQALDKGSGIPSSAGIPPLFQRRIEFRRAAAEIIGKSPLFSPA